MYPIIINNIGKYYKKYSHKHKFLTIKSALVNKTLFSDLERDEKFEALKGISFNVEDGKTLSIIGENGSGKSTLLKILAGITRPTSGEITTRGRISALIELGAGFHPEISGRENIFINGIILGLSKKMIQEKLSKIVEFSELEEFINSPVKTYSSGMYMRLGFSIAINVDPDILLIDEVLAVGDAFFVPKCIDKIYEFKRKGKTIIFVSHDLATVEKISDEVIWLKKGQIEMRGYPAKVVDAYMQYIGEKEEKRDEKPAEVSTENRWGSREIEIKNVKIMNRDGKEKYIYKPKEPMTIEFDVITKRKEDDFVFGLAIFNPEGILCYGSNTGLENYKSYHIEGKGKVKIQIPELPLINGMYFLDLAVHKKDGYPFDYHHFQYKFKVSSKLRDLGITRIPHHWKFTDNINVRPFKPKKR
ncbi:MAG: ABC transporter ATP-binding protein [Candidatus Aminicenantes bacterium]|nr:ABC transporter ATP-binding protein [Candidatus Aminicenantes bacterium]